MAGLTRIEINGACVGDGRGLGVGNAIVGIGDIVGAITVKVSI
jgi:hypothetical protein